MQTPLSIDEETGRPIGMPQYSVGGIILRGNHVAIVIQNDGFTKSFPKGHVNPCETHLLGAYREIFEETGIARAELRLVRELGWYERHTQIGIGIEDLTKPKRIRLWQFETDFEGKMAPLDVENPSARWVQKDKISLEQLHPKDVEFYLKQRELGYF